MITILDKPHINAEEAAEILRRHTAKGGVIIDLDRAIDYTTYYKYKYKHAVKEEARKLGLSSDYDPTPNMVQAVFTTYFKNELQYLNENLNSSTFKLTTQAKTITTRIQQGMFSKDAAEYLQDHLEITKIKKARSGFKSYLSLPILKRQTIEGHRAVLAKPQWETQATGRIGANHPNVQNLARETADVITTIEGYELLRYDSGQIEPRITYSYFIPDPVIKELIIMYDDAYFGQLHYILLSDEELEAVRRGDKKLVKMEITDAIKALRDDLKKLSLIGNYGGDLSRFDPKLAKGYKERITNHPKRLELIDNIAKAVKNGQNVFYSAFGTPIKPEANSKYAPGSKGWKGHIERCGLNNPIQATAADCMCESVYQQDKLLREQGSGKSWIGYYKHDEGCTYLHESDAHLKDEIIGMTAYQVRDWIPIHNDVEEGIKPSKLKGYEVAL